MEENENRIGKNLRFLRKRQGLSQSQLAEKLNMNRGNIASYEKGAAYPNAKKLLQIAKYFGVDMQRLVEEDLERSLEQQGEIVPKVARKVPAEELEKFRRQTKRYRKILEGLADYYEYEKEKALSGERQLSEAVRSMDIERLLEISQEVLKQNHQLLALLSGQEEGNG
ncbi:MAG: transcriptional regulator [Bacteroidetes bacterium]|nr:MAG: transcriptional regulator [Bacteroidota bacterium]